MKIYYKFTSAKDFSAIEIGGPFISVGSFKELIFESKYKAKKSSDDPRPRDGSLCLGTDLDLLVTNAQTKEEYVDDSVLIVANSAVLLRRIPGDRRRRSMDIAPIVTEPLDMEKSLASGSSAPGTGSSSSVGTDLVGDGDLWSHDFGEDVFALHGAVKAKTKSLPVAVAGEEGKDRRIRALVKGCYVSRSNKVVSGVKWMNVCGFGGTEGRTPPDGYICRRCNVSGHFILHCPTNGDPKYDFKRVRPPRGIPKSMLVVYPDGSYKLPSGECAVLKPNEDVFDREMEGLSSSSHSASMQKSIPPELHCPLCKQVIKDAVVTSRCCFVSFCDKCIRDHLVNSELKCVCEKSNVLADYLIPNMTLRDAIKRILETGSCGSSGDSTTSVPRVQEIDSACHRSTNVNVLGPEQSVLSSIERKRVSPTGGGSNQVVKRPRFSGATDVSEAQSECSDAKVQPICGDMTPTKKVTQQKTISSETEKRRKKKASRQQDAGGGYALQTASNPYESYWNGMQPWMQGYQDPYGNALPYTAYGLNSFGLAYPYGQGYMVPPQGF